MNSYDSIAQSFLQSQYNSLEYQTENTIDSSNQKKRILSLILSSVLMNPPPFLDEQQKEEVKDLLQKLQL